MQNKPKLRSEKVGGEREEFDVNLQPVPVRVERTIKDRLVDAITVATITIVATVAATAFSTWLLM